MKRRNFLAVFAAPLIVRPTLEEIERLNWKRKYFHPEAFFLEWPRIGETIEVRIPKRFQVS